jgi:hypothetical protein
MAFCVSDGKFNERSAAWFSQPVDIGNSLTVDFDVQEIDASADGFTFTLQGNGPTARGTAGGLGYAGIPNSFAWGFDLVDYVEGGGGGPNSIGWFDQGISPANHPSEVITSSGVNLLDSHIKHVRIIYGDLLLLTITDTVTGATFSTETSLYKTLTAYIGGNSAYIGFTASTSNTMSATQEILNWRCIVNRFSYDN